MVSSGNISISVLSYSSVVIPSAFTIIFEVVFEVLVAPANYLVHVYYVYLEDVDKTYFLYLKTGMST